MNQLTILAALLFAIDAQAAPDFVPLGDLPGGDFSSAAHGISADGATVVGSSISANGTEAVRWTSDGGMVPLGDLPGGIFQSFAHAVSEDGSTVAGQGDNGSGYPIAVLWNEGGIVEIGDFEGGITRSFGIGISGDGSTVVGYGTVAPNAPMAFRWTAATGMIDLGTLPGGVSLYSGAYAISTDGSTIVGSAPNAFEGSGEAFRWTATTGMVGLGKLEAQFNGVASGVSADGSTIVGSDGDVVFGGEFVEYNTQAFRWTNASGMVGLGNLPGGEFINSQAQAVSADGAVVVGTGEFPPVPGDPFLKLEAFIWDEANGMRELDRVLTDLGLDLTGWTLMGAEAISADGRKIVGYGKNPAGQSEGWLATISRTLCDDGIDNDADGLIDFPDDPQCDSIDDTMESPDLRCEVAMSQATYVDGEPVVITSLRFANLESTPIATRLRLQLTLPPPIPFPANAIDLGSDGSFSIPANFDNQLGPVTMFTLNPQIPLRGDFEWRCAFEDPATGAVISEQRAHFELQ